jgi:hypothetical protein
VTKIDMPPTVRKKFAYADEELSVLEGRVRIVVHLAGERGTPALLRLSYQACTDTACLPPVVRSVSIG